MTCIYFLFLMLHLWCCPILIDVEINLYQCADVGFFFKKKKTIQT